MTVANPFTRIAKHGHNCYCGFFEEEDKFGYPTDEKEFGVSHGVDMITGQSVVLPWVSHPELLGAKFDQNIISKS